MARISKQRGYGLEAKLVNWFNNKDKREDWPQGWESERNTLSREEKKFGQVTAKHDVKALKCLKDGAIFLQIEAKKTGKELLSIQKKWLDKIDFHKDELLVIALSRTDSFAFIDIERMPYLKKDCLQIGIGMQTALIKQAKRVLSCRGGSSVRVHKKEIEDATLAQPVILDWKNINRQFCIFPLVEFVALREQSPTNISLQQAIGLKKHTEDTDILTVEADIQKEITITCPRTGLPLRIIPIRS